MNRREMLRLGRHLADEHQLGTWKVVLDERAKVRAGQCRYRKHEIGLSPRVMETWGEADVRDTILHEIAHALVGPGHGHDRVWKAKAREIGANPSRTYNSELNEVPAAWVGTCPNGHETQLHREPQRVRSCGRCTGRVFSLDHLFTWKHNGRPVEPRNRKYQQDMVRVERLRQRRNPARITPTLDDIFAL